MHLQQRRNDIGNPICGICGKPIKPSEPAVRPESEWVHLRCARETIETD